MFISQSIDFWKGKVKTWFSVLGVFCITNCFSYFYEIQCTNLYIWKYFKLLFDFYEQLEKSGRLGRLGRRCCCRCCYRCCCRCMLLYDYIYIYIYIYIFTYIGPIRTKNPRYENCSHFWENVRFGGIQKKTIWRVEKCSKIHLTYVSIYRKIHKIRIRYSK